MKKIRQKLLSLAVCLTFGLSLLFGSSSLNPVYAGDAYLSPSSGTVTGTFTVTLVSSGANPGGVDVNINYSGPISFVSATASAGANCFSFRAVENPSGVVGVTCMSDAFTSGIINVAVLTFSVTGTGTATLTMTDEGDNLDNTVGATYITSTSTSNTGGTGSTLPNAGFGNVSIWFVVFIVAFIPIFFGYKLLTRKKFDKTSEIE